MESQNSTETTAGGWRRGFGVNGRARAARAPFGPTLALVLTTSVGAFFLIAPLARWVLPTTDVPAPFPDHHQDAETLLFVFAFAVLLPVAAAFVPRLADRLVDATDEASLSTLSALVAAGLLVAAAAVRAAGSGGAAIAVAMIAWGLLAAAALFAAASGRLRLGQALTSRRKLLWWATGCGSIALMLSFSDVGSIALAPLIVGVLIAAAVVRFGDQVSLPRLGRRTGLLVDGFLIVLLVLAIPNLVIFTSGSFSANVELAIIHFHQNFFLGPANQVLGRRGDAGRHALPVRGRVDLLPGGPVPLIPIGDGTLGLIEGVLSALMFCGGYLVVRAAGAPRLLAAAGFAVAVVVFVYGSIYPLGALLQHGAFRFGLPIGVLLGAVIEARWPHRATAGRALQLLTMAVASIWALEAFGYTLLTILAVISVRVWFLASAERRRAAIRGLIEVAVTVLAAHLLFDLLTLVFTGELPRWGWYLSTLREFLTGPVGDLTYDFSRWSPGLALGIVYFSSAAGLILLLRRRPDVARQGADGDRRDRRHDGDGNRSVQLPRQPLGRSHRPVRQPAGRDARRPLAHFDVATVVGDRPGAAKGGARRCPAGGCADGRGRRLLRRRAVLAVGARPRATGRGVVQSRRRSALGSAAAEPRRDRGEAASGSLHARRAAQPRDRRCGSHG